MALRARLGSVKLHLNGYQFRQVTTNAHDNVKRGFSHVLQSLALRDCKSSNNQNNSRHLFGISELHKPEGFLVLRDKALVQANLLIDQIVECSASSANSNNLVALFDELSNCLCKVADLAEFIRVAHPQPNFRATAEQASVSISTLVEKLNTDKRLYYALKQCSFKDELDNHVAKLFMFDFEQSAIHLDDDKRRIVLQLNENILKLGSIFAANGNLGRLVDTNRLPEKVRHFFNQTQSGKTLVTSLHADSDNELVRETAFKSYLQTDETQSEVLTNLLKSRLQLAQLCGFESYAHRAVKGGIAGSPEIVNQFLDILKERISDSADQDYEQMLHLKARDCNLASNFANSLQLHGWDVPYYSNIYKRRIYNESVVKSLPYFSVGVCMDGLDLIFSELYGVKMQVDNHSRGELWHKDIIKLNIINQENNELLGHIYCDLFERQMKLQQDCHHTIQGGCYLRDGSYQLPIVVLVLNIPRDSNNSLSLLSPNMVDNLFHEMGHAMHSMMARTKYQHITGTRCSTDLAEVPSILMEFFASDSRIVSKFARHYATDEPIPEDLLQSWIKSKKVLIASETQLQVFYSALDQAYHSASISELGKTTTTTEILARTQSKYYSIPYVEDTAWQLRFSHLVGYGAKYYSYLVSRAIATAIWTKLFANNPLSRAAGIKYKNEVLAHGGGKPAKKIAEDVLGCNVDADFIARSVIDSFQQPKVE